MSYPTIDQFCDSLVPAGEEGLAVQHLGKDAAHRPDVDGLQVRLRLVCSAVALTLPYMRNDSMTSGARYHRVATSAVSSASVMQHGRTLGEALLFGVCSFDSLSRTRKTEVADFEVAIGVEKQVRRLEVAVDNCGQHVKLRRRQTCSATHSRPNATP